MNLTVKRLQEEQRVSDGEENVANGANQATTASLRSNDFCRTFDPAFKA